MSQLESAQQRVALYARVSTEEQREGQTVESQLAELEKYAADKGLQVVETYKDEGWPGAILARPELDRMRDDASKRLFDAVLLNDVDRLARDVTHLGIIKRDLERQGVQVIFRKLPASDSPMHNLMVNILGSFAEFERELITDRTRRGRRHKVEVRQQFVGCVAPYGFCYKRKADRASAGSLDLVPEEVRVVRLIYQWAQSGLAMNKIARRLHELGVATRMKRKWSTTMIAKILRSEVYKGVWSYGKMELCEPQKRRNHNPYRRQTKTSRHRRPKDKWLQISLPNELHILEPPLWAQVQNRIDMNRRFSPRNRKHFYLLQGHLRCAHCLSVCPGTFRPRRDNLYFFYKCWRRCESATTFKRDSLDEAVWLTIRDALLNPDVLREHLQAAAVELSEESQQPREELQPEISKAAEEAEVFQRYKDGRLTPGELARNLEILAARRQESQQRGEVEGPQVSRLVPTSVQEICKQFGEELRDADEFLRREIFRELAVEAFVSHGSLRIRFRITPPLEQRSIEAGLSGITSALPRRSERNSPNLAFELTRALPEKGMKRASAAA